MFQEDTMDLKYSLTPQRDLTGFVCRTMVKAVLTDADGDALIDIDNYTLSMDTYSYESQLTASLDPGRYFMITQMYSSTTGQRKEIHERLIIKQQGIVA